VNTRPLRLAALCSGGKDSLFACWQAMQKEEVCCLVTVVSRNPESYMFHTPNIRQVRYQAEASGLPLVEVESAGVEETEVADLRRAVERARNEYGIEGVVTGAVQSVYQATRIQRICADLGLWCFNPLWQIDPWRYLHRLLSEGFLVCITGVAADPLDETWLGRTIEGSTLHDLERIAKRHRISPIGEGGEYETYVLDAPFFSSRISITASAVEYRHGHGTFHILDADLVAK